VGNASDGGSEHGLGGVRKELLSDVIPETGIGLWVTNKCRPIEEQEKRAVKNKQRIWWVSRIRSERAY